MPQLKKTRPRRSRQVRSRRGRAFVRTLQRAQEGSALNFSEADVSRIREEAEASGAMAQHRLKMEKLRKELKSGDVAEGAQVA